MIYMHNSVTLIWDPKCLWKSNNTSGSPYILWFINVLSIIQQVSLTMLFISGGHLWYHAFASGLGTNKIVKQQHMGHIWLKLICNVYEAMRYDM